MLDSFLKKMLLVLVIGLGLLIPLMLVDSQVQERSHSRDAVVQEIGASWGGDQDIIGPIIVVPYIVTIETKQQGGQSNTTQVRGSAYQLPRTLAVKGELKPQVLHRGIYEAVVYEAELQLTSTLGIDGLEESIGPATILWDEAFIVFSVSDLRGVSGLLSMQWGDKALLLEPGTLIDQPSAGAHVRLPADWREHLDQPITLSLRLKGSQKLCVAPVGVQTEVELTSIWGDPSFIGSVLPSERKLGPEGFTARWNASYYSRNFPQNWTTMNGSNYKVQLMNSGMGVELLTLIDSYRSVNRAVKYGILLIGLVFGTFFVLELLGSAPVHPFQYILVGMTLVVFYLGLLSLSEFVAFWLAYLLPALVATGMIAAYSYAMLRKKRQALFIFLGFAVVYAFMYVLLRLVEYSLVMGSAGLFLILGITMWATRNVQWYRPAPKLPAAARPDFE